MPWIPFTLQVLVQRPGVVLSDSVIRHCGDALRCCSHTKVKGEPYSTQIMIDEWSFGCKNSTDTNWHRRCKGKPTIGIQLVH